MEKPNVEKILAKLILEHEEEIRKLRERSENCGETQGNPARSPALVGGTSKDSRLQGGGER